MHDDPYGVHGAYRFGASPRGGERVQPLGLALAFVGAAGMSAGVTVLYRSMRLIMQTSGAFVAIGGPYVIEHPAPTWVWLVPVSIFFTVACTFAHVVAALRGWGANLVVVLWSALFVSLGWNFLELGWRSPQTGRMDWGWLAPGVVFWVMGLAPVAFFVRVFRRTLSALAVARVHPDARLALQAPDPRSTQAAYLLTQVIAIAAGITNGLLLFAAAVG